MDLMDEKEGENLKSHPKLMAAKIEVEKPAEEMMEESEEVAAPEMAAPSDDEEISPEMLQKLLEHFQDLK